MKRFILIALAMFTTGFGWGDDLPKSAVKKAPARVQYARDIQPILSSN